MDLGVTHMDDFSSAASILSPEEIAALLGPLEVDMPAKPSAIQVLLNQGAEALAQKPTSALEPLCTAWHTHLSAQNHKIAAITHTHAPSALGPLPLVCPFKTDTQNGFIAFDWTTSYLLVDGMLGGVNGLSIEKKPDQSYSPIEQHLLEPVLHHLLSALSTHLNASLTPLPLTTTLSSAHADTTRLLFTVRTPVSIGKIVLEIPNTLIPDETPEFLFNSPEEVLTHLSFETQAEAQTLPTTLKQIETWTVGTTLCLQPATRLTCGTQTLASGTIAAQGPARSFTVGDK